jgi:hypothetical protein
MSKKAWLAGLAGGVAAYLTGWLIYGVVLMKLLKAHTTVYPGLFKEEMNLVTIAIGCFVWSFTIAWVYSNFSGKKSILGGVITGAILGLLIETGMALSYLGNWNLYDTTYLIADWLAMGVYSAVVGAVVGWILREK